MYGSTPVFLTAENDHTQTVLSLVQKCGSDARTANNRGETLVWVHVPEWTH